MGYSSAGGGRRKVACVGGCGSQCLCSEELVAGSWEVLEPPKNQSIPALSANPITVLGLLPRALVSSEPGANDDHDYIYALLRGFMPFNFVGVGLLSVVVPLKKVATTLQEVGRPFCFSSPWLCSRHASK